MCGLAGFLDPTVTHAVEKSEAIALAMADALASRGPDDRGAWVDLASGVGFGHRRLAIVDLSPKGHQPMISSDGRWVIVYNGEIYNFAELRVELEGEGRSFRGRSDTEVLLEGVAVWGLEETLRRSIGMFALAVWDRRNRRLSLARDRLGIKPLYYGWSGTTFLFGSGLKALRAHPALRPEVDREALASFLRFSYVPSPLSIYRGISKLSPGTILEIDARRTGDPGSSRSFWRLRDVVERGREHPFRGDEADALEAFETILRDAVRKRMIADVPLGAFLSGGIDSSTVVSMMQAESSLPVRTFTIGFREEGYNEADAAREIAHHLETDHTELIVEPAHALEMVTNVPEHFDEPFGDPSQIPTLLVSEMTRRHVTVALSGDGGDELFGGYLRYDWARRIHRWIERTPGSLRRGFARALLRIPPTLFDRAGSLLPSHLLPSLPGDKIHKLAAALLPGRESFDPGEAVHLRLLTAWEDAEQMVRGAAGNITPRLSAEGASQLPELISRMMFVDSLTYLPDDILTKVDRASMAFGLEARVPILDHRVVELAWSLPLKMNFEGGVGKKLLRKVLYRHVPRALVDRPKMGFGMPIDDWLRGALRDWAEGMLDPRRLRHEGFFDPGPIRKRWEEHLSGRRNWHYSLWDVLMFQAWAEKWT